MKKRIRLVVLSALAIITAALLWKFVPWATLKARYSTFSISDLPPVWYYSTVIIIALLLMTAIWFVLQIVPKRQAQALQKPEKKRLADKLEVDEDGSLYTLQSSLKPSELFTIENEARKTLSQIIGGFIVIVSLILTGANLAITSRLTQEGQITDRFTKAITQLGDSKLEVRLGGIYALERIANDSEKDHWTIMEVLTAYIRENARAIKPEPPSNTSSQKKKGIKEEAQPAKPNTDIQAIMTQVVRETENITSREKSNTDIQAILTVIGRRKADGERKNIDLKYTDLRGMDLFKANLQGADLFLANFLAANLQGANLQGAKLTWADLGLANLQGADLQGADFRGATLTLADLGLTDIRGAKNLTWEQVSKAIIDDGTKLPPEIENQHKDELKAMREKTRKEREGK